MLLVLGLVSLYLPISHVTNGGINSRFEATFSFTLFPTVGILLVRTWWRLITDAPPRHVRSRLNVALSIAFFLGPVISIGDPRVYHGPLLLDGLKLVGVIICYWFVGLGLLALAGPGAAATGGPGAEAGMPLANAGGGISPPPPQSTATMTATAPDGSAPASAETDAAPS